MLEFQIAALVVATLSLYSYRADFAKYSIFTVGVFKRLDRTVVEGADYECAEFHCEDQTEISERRRYYKEIVVAGMPLLRYDKGESHYCEDHVSFEVHDELDNPKRSRTERVGTTLLAGFISFVEWWGGMKEVEEEDGPFSNVENDVTASVGDAFALIPVVILVLFAALAMTAIKGLYAPHE